MVHYNFAYPNHLIVDLYGVPEDRLDDVDLVSSFARESAEVLGSTIVKQVYRRTHPGLIYIAVLLQSHISYHSWPELGYAALDIYACSDVPVTKALSLVSGYFSPRHMRVTFLDRRMPTSSRELI